MYAYIHICVHVLLCIIQIGEDEPSTNDNSITDDNMVSDTVSVVEETSDEATTETQVRSTKRPTSNKDKCSTKRKKQADQEDLLLQKALLCMERAEEGRQGKLDDDDEIFARFIATEIRSIKDHHVKRIVK